MKINYPIILIVYNRPDHTKKILSQLNNFKIKKLYIISDGPKAKSLDIKNVEKTRKIVDEYLIKSKIKFKFKIYSNKNLGLRKRIISGLNTVFKREKVSIILEDDCIPTKDFFNFIDVMLKKFKNDRTIASIGGSNYFPKFRVNSSYLKSKYFNPWGWATWKDRWQNKNLDPDFLLNSKKNYVLKKYLGSFRAKIYWRFKIWLIKKKRLDSWAYSWMYYNFLNKKKHILPSKNLINNIGIGVNSTNTRKLPYKYFFKKYKKKYSFNLPYILSESIDYDRLAEDKIFSKNFLNRLRWLFQ